ncbi:MAG: hypothetical protein LBD75_08200, partial [Candidatus Peribacteria bacterium]|nr:hypothetical protein [Candidatus Peribacteria bacterium]
MTGGVLFLGEGYLTGKFLTSQIEPASMRYWERLNIEHTDPSGSSIQISLIDCESEAVLPNRENIPYNTPLSLSGIDKTVYSCLQVQVEVARAEVDAPSPIFSKVDVTYLPYPILTARITPATNTAEACSNLKYNLNFTNNYVNDMGVVLYASLPTAEAGTITGYDTTLDLYPRLQPQFISAEGGGKYTSTGIRVNNQDIPANSVYRDIGILNAGETRMYGFSITVPCDTMNGTFYLIHATIAGMLADAYETPQVSTPITAQARPKLTKGAQGTFSYGTNNYLYLAYNPTLKYMLTASNPQGTELLQQPILTDNLADLQTKFSTQCTGGSLAERISEISTGGVLSGATLIWNLANIGRNQSIAVSYKVNFSGCNVDGM